MLSLVWIALGLTLLVVGGDALVRGAVGLAEKARVPRALVGSTIVAAGTSMPELVVSLQAAFDGSPDLSVGNVVGSNLYNVLLVLGLAILIRPCAPEGQIVRLDAPAMVAASIGLAVVSLDGTVSRVEGGVLALGGLLYLAESGRRALAERSEEATESDSLPVAIVATLLGFGLLIGGARALVYGAVEIASALGVTERVIGLTVVAIGTSLPELFASVAAARRGEGGIAIGNVVGSNLFNIVGILGPVAAILPLAVNPAILASDLPWMIGVAVVLMARLTLGGPIGRAFGAGLVAIGIVYTILLLRTPDVPAGGPHPGDAPHAALGDPLDPQGDEAVATTEEAPTGPRGLTGTRIAPSARPARSPVELTPRVSATLGGVRIVQLAPPNGRWLLVEEGGVVAHLEATAPVEIEDGELYVGGEPCDVRGLPATIAPWVRVCPNLWRRHLTEGRKTRLEWGSDLVRDYVKGGEQLTEVVKTKVVGDKYRRAATRIEALEEAASPGAPAALAVTDKVALKVPELGLPVVGAPERLTAGRFYPVDGAPGVHLAALTPDLLVERVEPLEADATVVFVAFDLSAYSLDYHLGTEHPRLGFAEKVPAQRRDGLAGPDGFDGPGPLQRSGQVGPDDLPFAVATFTAGFKRSHGAFHRGELAKGEHNSHYGFVEEGVPWSWLQPGLATLYVTWDGEVGLRTWGADGVPADVRYARQNGAPLVRADLDLGPRLGELVGNLADGNWSGSVEGNARSLRAGACMREQDGRRDLIYGYFTAATPATMAKTFLAAGCQTAMLLDMNALEHTYLAVYTRDAGERLRTWNLDTGMAVLDQKAKDGTVIPRFLAFADNRDFFVVRPRAR